MLDTVIDTVWLRLFVLWDFLISWIRLLIVFGCHPSRTLNYDFMLAILVTPRIINFRLAPASASLRLTRSLRIYYSMLWGSGICHISFLSASGFSLHLRLCLIFPGSKWIGCCNCKKLALLGAQNSLLWLCFIITVLVTLRVVTFKLVHIFITHDTFTLYNIF